MQGIQTHFKTSGNPSIWAVLDPTLMDTVDLTHRLGTIIVVLKKSPLSVYEKILASLSEKYVRKSALSVEFQKNFHRYASLKGFSLSINANTWAIKDDISTKDQRLLIIHDSKDVVRVILYDRAQKTFFCNDEKIETSQWLLHIPSKTFYVIYLQHDIKTKQHIFDTLMKKELKDCLLRDDFEDLYPENLPKIMFFTLNQRKVRLSSPLPPPTSKSTDILSKNFKHVVDELDLFQKRKKQKTF